MNGAAEHQGEQHGQDGEVDRTLFLLPAILMYTAWSYWVFRGKVRGGIGYHP